MELPIDERISCCSNIIEEKDAINTIRNLKAVKRKQEKHASIDEKYPEIYCFCKEAIDKNDVICKKYFSYIDENIALKFQTKSFDKSNDKYVVKIIDNLNFTVENTGKCRFLIKENTVPENYNYKNDTEIIPLEIDCLNKEEQLFLFPFAPSYVLLVGKQVNDFLVLDMRQITVLQNVTIKHLLNENNNLNTCVSTLSSRVKALEQSVLDK